MDHTPLPIPPPSNRGSFKAPPLVPDTKTRTLTSPGTALFDTTFQGGPAVEVFGAGGSNPTSNWKVSGGVQRVYDKSVKGYVFRCEGGPSAKMQLPRTTGAVWAWCSHTLCCS